MSTVSSLRVLLQRSFNMLEITCNNSDEHQNLIFESELKINKVFTCDECEDVILVVDKVLLEVIK